MEQTTRDRTPADEMVKILWELQQKRESNRKNGIKEEPIEPSTWLFALTNKLP